MLLGLQRPELIQEILNRLCLRKPGDVELLGAFLGADKDRVRCVRAALLAPALIGFERFTDRKAPEKN